MRRADQPSLRNGSQRGAALLAVLWIVALLIGLVAGASLLLMQDLELGTVKRQVFRARMIGESALAIAMNQDIKPDDPLLRQSLAPDERYEVEIVGEDALLNPNAILARGDRDTLRRVFRYWGLNPQQSELIIVAMLDWVDPDDFVSPGGGAESKAYGRNGMPFNRPFRSVEEMGLVRGMRELEAIYPGWRTWFSVYASGALDINEARPEILSAVAGVDIRSATQFRAMRLGRDGLLNTQDDNRYQDIATALPQLGATSVPQPVLMQILTVNSNIRRILVKVQVGDFKREVAVVTQGSPTPGGAGGSTAILWMGEN